MGHISDFNRCLLFLELGLGLGRGVRLVLNDFARVCLN